MPSNPADRSDAERWLDQIWLKTTPPAPSEEAWAAVLARIEAALPAAGSSPAVPRPPRRRPAWLLFGAGGLSAAAAVLLFVFLGIFGPRPPGPAPKPDGEPWPVAADSDVEIISMDGGDVSALAVGRPPQTGPLELASLDEVLIDDTGHDVEVKVPQDLRPGQSVGPMIIMPLDVTAGRQ
jgi:hypothetical protein